MSNSIVMGKYREVDPDSGFFLGHRFEKDGKVSGDMKCPLCGRWFAWDRANINKYALERRWNETRQEPEHCGKSHCYDYHMRYLKHKEKMKFDVNYRHSHFIELQKRKGLEERDSFKLFQNLKANGVVV